MGMFRGKRPVDSAAAQHMVKAAVEPAAGPSSNERILEQRLREAVAAGKFNLQYQSLVAVDDGLVGFEALLRWESEAGRVTPATFIPVLEATGLIKDIGPWVLAEACRQAQVWSQTHPKLLLAVNISPQQLELGFADSVVEILHETGFDAERLCLELIQPTFIADAAEAWSELRRLKALGIRLFVDDFGTLGSSIADLRRFAVDAVKIDSSFVSGLGHGVEDEAVVAAIVALAHALGMRTIAEGVETSAQLEGLRAMGCDLAQGFHLMEPATPARVKALLDNGAAAAA